MNKRDFYEVLNLAPTCSLNDVRTSYRKLALKWHPDKCLDKIGAEQMFGEIHEAYSVLSDDRKKQIYDNYGHEGLELEQNCAENSDGTKKNFFFQKGFQGTDKSAFDILQGIFKDTDDDCFFENFDTFGISDNLKSSIKSFIDTNVFCQDSNDGGSNFFETYKPSFVNPEFFMTPPMFGSSEDDESCTTHFFSSFVSNAGDQTFSRTSTTVFVNGKATTSTKDTFQNGNGIFEQQEINEFEPKKSDLNYDKLFNPMFSGNVSDIIILDDADNNIDDPLFDVLKDIKSFANNKFCQGLSIHQNSKVSSASKKIIKEKDPNNIRLTTKKPSKKAKV